MKNKINDNKINYYYEGILELYCVVNEKDKVYPEPNMRRMFICKIVADSHNNNKNKNKRKLLEEHLTKLSMDYLNNLNRLNQQTQRYYETLNEIKLIKYHRIQKKEYTTDFMFA